MMFPTLAAAEIARGLQEELRREAERQRLARAARMRTRGNRTPSRRLSGFVRWARFRHSSWRARGARADVRVLAEAEVRADLRGSFAGSLVACVSHIVLWGRPRTMAGRVSPRRCVGRMRRSTHTSERLSPGRGVGVDAVSATANGRSGGRASRSRSASPGRSATTETSRGLACGCPRGGGIGPSASPVRRYGDNGGRTAQIDRRS